MLRMYEVDLVKLEVWLWIKLRVENVTMILFGWWRNLNSCPAYYGI
jgi:hypothetical protein